MTEWELNSALSFISVADLSIQPFILFYEQINDDDDDGVDDVGYHVNLPGDI